MLEVFKSVLVIRICRIHTFLGLPDLLVLYEVLSGSGFGYFYHQSKIVKKPSFLLFLSSL
jgi:hypothetical protein